MNANVERLFDEFASAWARGDRPDVRDYLERAGAERDELAALLDGFLAASTVQPPSEETLATFYQLVPEDPTTPPLLAERVRRGWTRDEVVDWIRERFGIAEVKRPRLARYWHELETGLLPAARVSRGLREALAERFGAALATALTWEPPELRDAAAAFHRLPDLPQTEIAASVSPPAPASPAPEPDDVDMLFTAGD